MKKLFHFCIFCSVARAFASIPLTDDFNKAKEIAEVYNKPMVVLFTGSDWCQWSKKILSEILPAGAFGESVGNQFIFVKVDFPEINRQPKSLLNQNQELRELYHVDSFPTVVMLDAEGHEVTRLGYVREGADHYASHLKKLYFDYQLLDREVKGLDFAKASIKAIEALYQRAAQLQSPHIMEKLLEVGLAANEGVAIPLEKYTQLVQNDQANTLFAESLKKTIIARDPDNQLGTRLRLALLDFQANEKNPEKAVQALGTYIADFGKNDKGNLWRLHMIISDYFTQHGKEAEAKEYAEKCLAEAPENVKQEISNMLKSSGAVPSLDQK